MKISKNIQENIHAFQGIFAGCADIKMQEMLLGKNAKIKCFLFYIEGSVKNTCYKDTALGGLVSYLEDNLNVLGEDLLDENGMGILDLAWYDNMEDAAQGMLTGDAILFIDGYGKGLKIADQGYPGLGVQKSDAEKVSRGSNEAFTDSIKINSALIRKRIRSTRLRVEEINCGQYSHTAVDLIYMDGLAYPNIVGEIKKRIGAYEMDGLLDSGVLEQLSEKCWYSPFPQFQTTQRPDLAALSILEGRIVVLCDNSPVALILPTDINAFLKTSDDYYNRFTQASFARILRFLSCFFSMTLPGLYLALINYHTQLLPTSLLLAFQEARQQVPFPSVWEVMLMESSFELLREAGIRIPGAIGNTIGIVGGLIIGQAAVEANLVSPIVVILVAFTALCSFAIPNEELAFSFRLIKFGFIILCAWLGYFGFLLGIMCLLIHLSRLESFGIPYMMPFIAADMNDYGDELDFLVRFPLRFMKKRPIYSRRQERTRLKKRGE